MRRAGRARTRGGRARKRSDSCRSGAAERVGDPDHNVNVADDDFDEKGEVRRRSNACRVAADGFRQETEKGWSEANGREGSPDSCQVEVDCGSDDNDERTSAAVWRRNDQNRAGRMRTIA